jgi:DNA-binding NarL/FixJ family response regulator
VYSILLIEDDSEYIRMMEDILQLEGFDVICAADGKTGLNLLRSQRPDLILCDIMMPDMDGHAVLESVKKEGTCGGVPFIFVTALADRSDVRRGMSAGADDYLPKPFSVDELLSAVIGRINRHRLQTQCHDASEFMEERTKIRTKTTKREREVLAMVGQGHSSQRIAESLGVSIKTINVHRTNLMSKLGCSNAASLARWAFILVHGESIPE